MAGPIRISILANASQAKRELDSVAGTTSSLGDKFRKFGRVAAAGLAVAGVAAVKFAAASVKSASDAQQSIGATQTVYGRFADEVIKRSEDAANSVGLSANEYRELANVMGASLKGAGIPLRQTTTLTADLTKRAADMSATFGGTTREAIEAVGSALRGETDPIEKYGVSIKATDVSARLAAKGLDDLTGKSLKQAEMTERLDLIMGKTADTQGAFARESNTLAGQQQRLAANWENLKVKIGNALIPVLTRLVGYVTGTVIPTLERWWDKLAPAREAISKFAGGIAEIFGLIRDRNWEGAWGTFKTGTDKALDSVGEKFRTFATDKLIPAIGRALARAHGRWAKGWENWWKDPEKSYDKTLLATDNFGVELRGKIVHIGVEVIAGFMRSIRGFPSGAAKVGVDTIRALQQAWRGAPGLARHVAIDIAGSFIGGLRSLPGGARSIAIDVGLDLIGGLRNAIDGARAIGTAIINGLIGGITDVAERVAETAANVVTNAIQAARNAAGIKSPSRVFRKIGHQSMEGLILGFKDGTSGVEKVLGRLRTLIKNRVIKESDERRFTRWLGRVDDALVRNSKLQDRNTAKIRDARNKLNELIQASKDYARNVATAMVSSGAITGLGKNEDGSVSILNLIAQLKDRVEAAKRYASLIQTLTESGLNKTSLQQLIDAGVEGGLATAEALASGGQDAISEINKLTTELKDTGTQMGESTSKTMYGAGIKAARGFLQGLEKEGRRLDRVAERLVRSLVRAVKEKLKIKSPSRVFQGLGQDVTKGLTLGLDETYVKRAGTSLATSLEKGFGTPALDAFSASIATSSENRLRVTLTADQVSQLQRGREVAMDLDAYYAAGGRRKS